MRSPSKPVEAGRWWLPGTRVGDEAAAARHGIRSPLDFGFRAHNTNVYPQRPDRCYLGYLDAGVIILDISDKSDPKVVSRWDNSPPYPGFTHTVLPLFERQLFVVTDESVVDDGADWPKLVWMRRRPRRDQPRADRHLPAAALRRIRAPAAAGSAPIICTRTCRCRPPSVRDLIFGTWFNGGLRVYDLSDPYRPAKSGYFVPPAPEGSPAGAIQLNDVFVDERGIVYTVDRHVGGLYILETEL